MEFEDVIMGGRSIRGYKSDPVPRAVIREIVALATRAPSSMNTQPWHLHVVTAVMCGFRQFDAPVSIVVCFDKELVDNDIASFDCGAVVNCLVNAAWSKGLGTVINGQGIMQSPVVREHARIPDDQIIMSCIAMGYPAEEFAANDVVSKRREVDEVVSFVGFDD